MNNHFPIRICIADLLGERAREMGQVCPCMKCLTARLKPDSKTRAAEPEERSQWQPIQFLVK